MSWTVLVLLAGAVLTPCPGLAQHERIDAEVARVLPAITAIRHRIHQNPELGNREFQTAALVADHLRELGFDDVRTGVAHTGVVGILRGGRPGPVVAVRADMDALPVTEDTDLPFKSTVRTTYLDQDVGVMHACGHDVHTAVQLGVASVLASMRADLPGTVKFIFQPAEEGPPPGETGGAVLMMAEGVFDDPTPTAVFGLHTFADMDVGQLGYTPGPAFAASDHFAITILGRQSHGAYPHQAVDPVVMASQAVTALQTIRSRNLDPRESAVISVGIIRGGTRFNIIPDAVRLEGTVRSYSVAVQDQIERRMREIVDGITRAGGGSFELQYTRGTPATINDVALSLRTVPSLERVVGADNVIEIPPTMGAEDFAEFANAAPGFYFRLGTADPGVGSGGHHTPTFRADDAALPIGIRAISYSVWDYLRGSTP